MRFPMLAKRRVQFLDEPIELAARPRVQHVDFVVRQRFFVPLFVEVRGKANKIRQTGRSKGQTVLRREKSGTPPRITGSARIADLREAAQFNPTTGLAHIRLPVAPTQFRPRHAYKALAKIGIALLPSTELDQFSDLTAWVLDAKEEAPLHYLGVGLCLGSLGNSPPLVAGTLLRRVAPAGPGPYMVLLVAAGSVCLQIELPTKAPTTIDPQTMATVGIQWMVAIGDGAGAQTSISYDFPILLDWASPALRPQPIEAFDLASDPLTGFAQISPIFRA
jgi:hypothetical protein